MSEDLKQDLVRATRHYPPPQDALERLASRRDHRRHVRRRAGLLLGVTAVALFGGLVWLGLQLGHRQATGKPAGTPETPKNGELLYAKKAPEGWHLFAFDPSSGQEQELTHGIRDYGSDWSPDGTKIVYDSEAAGGSNIVVANADGSDPVVIGTGEDPAWSPDGTRIAYAGDGGSIWVVNADGSDAHSVTVGAAAGQDPGTGAPYDWNPAWSPDGRSIAYTRVVAHRFVPLAGQQGQVDVTLEQLRVWQEGTPPTDTILTDAYTYLGQVDWSPDGSTIVFTGAPTLFHEKEATGYAWPRVLLIPSQGGHVTPISPDEQTWAAGATWSPDGTLIAYVDNNHSLVVMRPDGTDRRTLPIDPGDDEIIGPSWGVARSG